MSTDAQPDPISLLIAEEVLRTIYGDDLKGCTVSLQSIGEVIDSTLKQRDAQRDELLGLYEKVVEAAILLSTPPDVSKVTDPKELQALLSQRLDSIQAIMVKTRDTTALYARQPDEDET